MNLQPERAWQMVLGQLQLDMSKASFDTWVKDTEFISFENGLLTVGVANAYASEWLSSRLSSTVSRFLAGLLNLPVSVQFVVHDHPIMRKKKLRKKVSIKASLQKSLLSRRNTIPFMTRSSSLTR